ncbi:MAG: KTSC domain-containing protein [Planctomycetota bacterium]
MSVKLAPSQQALEIEFTNGAVYRYFDVPPEVYHGLMAAESHGRYFHQHVRSAGYRYERMTTSDRGAASPRSVPER